MPKIGIDFGTSFSVASYIDPVTHEAKPIRIDGQVKVPTLLYFAPDRSTPLVGQTAHSKYDACKDAVSQEEMDLILSGIVSDIKRNMSNNASIALPNGQMISYAKAISYLFAYIKKTAEDTCFAGQAVDAVCITYPVAFDTDPAKKQILQEAASMAGFTEVRLLMEPVAAAMGYFGRHQCRNTGVLIYDFGGGTFDLALVKFDYAGRHMTYSINGNPNCGGENIDHAIYEAWDQIVYNSKQRHISQFEGEDYVPILKTDCVAAKELMSRGSFDKRMLFLPPDCYVRERVPAFTSEQWDELVSPWVDKTIGMVRQLLSEIQDNDSGFSVDKVIMIGGSSRLPQVRERLTEVCPVAPEQTQDDDTAVANGAAIFINEDQPQPRDVFCINCGSKITTLYRKCIYCNKDNWLYDYRLSDFWTRSQK